MALEHLCKVRHRRRVSSSFKMLILMFPTESACHWCCKRLGKLYEKQTTGIWYLVQQKGNVVLWHQVHCGLSSIKGKIDKMGPFISFGALGFTAALEDCINAKHLKTDILGFFLRQNTTEAHALCMSYITYLLLYIHGPPLAL